MKVLASIAVVGLGALFQGQVWSLEQAQSLAGLRA